MKFKGGTCEAKKKKKIIAKSRKGRHEGSIKRSVKKIVRKLGGVLTERGTQ